MIYFLKKDLLKSQMIDANAKEVGIYLKSDIRDPIKKESKLVRLVKKFASNGYGYLKVDGRDSNNNEIQIDTEEDKELQKRTYINSSLKNSSVAIYEQIKNTER